MRNFGLAAAAMMMVPFTAQALSVSIVSATSSGASNTLLQPGETITFDLRVENGTATDVFGLGLGVRGYDANANGLVDDGLSFTSGQVTGAVFGIDVDPGVGLNSQFGLVNQQAGPVELGFYNPITFTGEEKRVRLFNGISVTAANGDGSEDVGIGGGQTTTDVHFQVVFTNTPVGIATQSFTLDFGTMADLGDVAVGSGGSILSFGNVQYQLSAIPEPGTALLMGLGLAGLASVRRR